MPIQPSRQPLLIFVGGFLGAGKTTLILKASELLRQDGRRVAVITNDQDVGLVDTLHARAHHLPTSEVASGCFCCHFSEMLEAADQLAAYQPEFIFAEPVGSCVDLSATLLRPLLQFHSSTFRVAPLTVVLDPEQAGKLAKDQLAPDIDFLTRNQLAEADLVCLSKRDASLHPVALPFPIDFHLSALTGEGVEDWLSETLSSSRVPGAHWLNVDYGRYAAAEAALGWLNLHTELNLELPVSSAVLVGPLLEQLDAALTSEGIVIAHLKIFDRTDTGWLNATLPTNGAEPIPAGRLLSDPTTRHQVVINLRALADPEQLERIALDHLSCLPGKLTILHQGAFLPAPPVPEHRIL